MPLFGPARQVTAPVGGRTALLVMEAKYAILDCLVNCIAVINKFVFF